MFYWRQTITYESRVIVLILPRRPEAEPLLMVRTSCGRSTGVFQMCSWAYPVPSGGSAGVAQRRVAPLTGACAVPLCGAISVSLTPDT